MKDQETAESARRIDAAEANRMAQELNNEALGVDEPVHEIPTENRTGGDRIDSTPAVVEDQSNDYVGAPTIFPPDIDGDATVGGDPESKAVLREEENS